MPDSTVSDKEVDKAREKVNKLVEQIAEEASRASAAIRSSENTVRLATLEGETERLERELAVLKENNNKAALKASTKALAEDAHEGQLTVTPAPGGGTTEEKK